MYNGIGLTTVRGSGTSGYVQANKFNLRNQRDTGRQNAKPGDPGFDGPKQTKANEAILEHNRKREVEKKLLELQDELIDKGFAEDEIMERLDVRRQELLVEAEQQSNEEKIVTETHALAKKKAAEMDKIRNAFGFSEDQKEGQAFDRELQERLKQERIAAKEKALRDKAKEDRKRKKAEKKEAKQKLKDEKKRAKKEAAQAAAKAKEEKKLAKERAAKEAERTKLAAEAKERRQKDLQARLGPRPDGGRSSDRDAEKRGRSPARKSYDEEPDERYIPRELNSDEEAEILPGSPLLDEPVDPAEPSSGPSLPSHRAQDSQLPRPQDSGLPSEQPSSISPAVGLHRSETPSPSPRQARNTRKRPPPPRTLSPERSGPRASPPPRKRTRVSTSPAPPPRRPQHSPEPRRNGYDSNSRRPEAKERRPSDYRRGSPSSPRRRRDSPGRDRHTREHRKSPDRRYRQERENRRLPSPPRRQRERSPRRRSVSPVRAASREIVRQSGREQPKNAEKAADSSNSSSGSGSSTSGSSSSGSSSRSSSSLSGRSSPSP